MPSSPPLTTLAWTIACVLPLITLTLVLRRRSPALTRRAIVALGGLGALAGLVVVLLERPVLKLMLGAEESSRLPLLVTLGFVGPLEEALKVAAVWPFFRARQLKGPLEGVAAALVVGSVFALVHGGWLLFSGRVPADVQGVLGIALLTTMQALLSSAWGFVLGHSYKRAHPRRSFFPTWIATTAAHGLLIYALSQHSVVGLLLGLPLLLTMLVLAFLARAELIPDAGSSRPRERRRRVVLADVRDALTRRERPLSVGRVAFGTLVNQGVLLMMLVLAIALVHRAGLDLTAVDDVEADAALPLLLLAAGAAVAFPVAGFLIARGSDQPTLIEPVLSAALAIAMLVVLLGVASPPLLAFTLACAPVALSLACAGAWVGAGR